MNIKSIFHSLEIWWWCEIEEFYTYLYSLLLNGHFLFTFVKVKVRRAVYPLWFSLLPNHPVLASLPKHFPTARSTPRRDPKRCLSGRRKASVWDREPAENEAEDQDTASSTRLLNGWQRRRSSSRQSAGINRVSGEDKGYRRELRLVNTSSRERHFLHQLTDWHSSTRRHSLSLYLSLRTTSVPGRELSSAFARTH